MKKITDVISRYPGTKIGDYFFVRTSSACPEQYDVFDTQGDQVGYVRLRHGSLSAQSPDIGCTDVYSCEFPENIGCFSDSEERMKHLLKIAEAIKNHRKKEDN